MKKLFALVLVLAMAAAIAVPAMAAGWDAIPGPVATIKDIKVELTPLALDKTTGIGGGYYAQLAAPYPVVTGTKLHFYVEITIPKAENLSAANLALLANKKLTYNLTSTNLENLTGVSFVDGVDRLLPDVTSETFTTSDVGKVWGYEYWATAKSSKAPEVKATIGYYNTWSSGEFLWDNDADGVNEFKVVNTGDGYRIEKVLATGFEAIYFPVKDTKVDTSREIMITTGDPSVQYAVNRSVNGDITFRNITTQVVTTPSDTGYAAIKAAFDSYFTALGFGYPDAKYMTDDHFTGEFGDIMKANASYSWSAGAVIIDPNAPKPPQTGDATTVVGFVMIALALVAAAAVTVKKVRA